MPDEQNIACKIEIILYDNGGIFVVGPVENFMLFRDMMNAAERIVLQKIAQDFRNSLIVPANVARH